MLKRLDLLGRIALASLLLLAGCGDDAASDGEGGSGEGGDDTTDGAGGAGGQPVPCEPTEPLLLATLSYGPPAALDVSAEGVAVLSGDQGARLTIYAPDGAALVEHDLGKPWGSAVKLTPAGTLAILSVENAEGWTHLEAVTVAPTGELLAGPTVVSPPEVWDPVFEELVPAAAGEPSILFQGDRFLVIWQNAPFGGSATLAGRYIGLDGQPVGQPFTVIDEDLYHYVAATDAGGVAVIGTKGEEPVVVARLAPGSTNAEVHQLTSLGDVSWPYVAGDGSGKMLAGIRRNIDDMIVMSIDGGTASAPKSLPYSGGPLQHLSGGRYAMLANAFAASELHLLLLEPDGTKISDTLLLADPKLVGWQMFAQEEGIKIAYSLWSNSGNQPADVYLETVCPDSP
jgi:hypothetical protein